MPRPAPHRAPAARTEHLVQRYSVLGAILLCTLISGLLGDSLLGIWRLEPDAPIPGGWRWLLGSPVQTFRTETIALFVGVVLTGFALGGVWFLITAGWRWLRRRL
ncbi:MAG: hypothetical protein QM346_02880 [Chloroflexota bacterium]|nr:hypothetical protein [Chloroflexota bacterium]